MSWDVTLVCDECLASGESCDSAVDAGNYTYNVSPMFVDAMGVSISAFHGAPAVEAAGVLRGGIDRMESEPERYRAMNPPNGWGNYETALVWLRKFYGACIEMPEGRICVY